MELKWTSKALSDLSRLYEFLAPVNRAAAARTVQSLTAAPTNLPGNPRIGERLEEFDPREVRRILVGHYEMRYEIREPTIYVLRLLGCIETPPFYDKWWRNSFSSLPVC